VLRVFENRILRRIFGPKRDEKGEWRNLIVFTVHLRSPPQRSLSCRFTCSPNIVRVIKPRRLRWAGHVARTEEGRSAFKLWTGKPTGNTPLGSTRCRWEGNIMDLKEIGINTRNWIDSAQDKDYWRVIVNAALNLRFP